MLACVDVAYREPVAYAACLVFESWSDAREVEQVVAASPVAAPYRPGAFFERELPAILAVLERVTAPLETVVVDGYVWLGGARPGLGARLHEARGTPVIGVAKTAWPASPPGEDPRRAVPVHRGRSARPLFVTSAGIEVTLAANLVRDMHGEHRIPTLLRTVDRLARDEASGARTRPATRE
jgi:deoxyribonuclease V